MRWLVALLAVAVLTTGCVATPGAAPTKQSLDAPNPPGRGEAPVTCLVTDAGGSPVANATCDFTFGGLDVPRATAASGRVTLQVPLTAVGWLRAEAPGQASPAAYLQVSGPSLVHLTLQPGNATDGSPAPGRLRSWGTPVTVTRFGNEPQMAAGPHGALYVSPLNRLYRSLDGGTTWTDVTPRLPRGAPTHLTDTSLDVGPNGSVWFARDWPYAGPTQACTSADRGGSWTCNAAAIPGATDRMWILGLSNRTGFVQTNLGLYHPVWARTTDGSHTYAPWATETTPLDTTNGNMVWDATRHAVWQVDAGNRTLRLWRVDAAQGLVNATPTTVPNPLAIPSLAEARGVLWTTGEVVDNGTAQVVAARSTDGGRTWTTFHVADLPQASTFGYVAALPDGRVAVAYYGSDHAGMPSANGGNWSTYVATTSDGDAAHPTWVETRVSGVVHRGSLCIGLGCADGSSDPNARFAGDLLGVTLDPTSGNAHVAYVRMLPDGSTEVRTVGQTG